MKLIIAEKPSLAKNIANALGVKERKDGYIENSEYIVSWAFGHIFELYSIYNYLNDNEIKWKEIPLPFIPGKFLYKLKNDEGIKKQFKILKELINRNDVTEIINCGDADREGQLIIDNIIKEIGTTKAIKRLWLPEQTEETIRKEIRNLKNNENYRNLYNEGLSRTELDWLLGINLTVYLTVKSGQKLACGRVLIPIVKYIYDRDMEIKNFISKKYYQVEGILEKDNIKVTLTDERKEDTKEKANEIAKKLSGKVKIIEIEKKEITKQPSKLFSLSTLQSFLSKNNKIDFATSLKSIQSLYEQGYITYPRTNTEYLAENEKDKVKKIIETLKDYPLEFKDTKKIFDDSKIESHSAITITTKVPQDLKDNEKLIYEVVKNRFISNFLSEKTITEKTTVTIQSLKDENITFKLTGETVVQEGFYKYEPKDFKNELPQFIENEEFEVKFEAKEKKTSPSKKVTEEELSNYLKNPFKKELKDNDDEAYKAILEGVEIGTEATRTGIIENAKKYGYISQKKSTYSIEMLGEKLIEILDKLNINLYSERTVEFSKLLKKIYREEKSIDDILDLAKKELNNIINQNVEIEKINKTNNLDSLGTCPICGKNIYERKSKNGKIFYSCEGYKEGCTFTLWEDTKYFDNTLKITKVKAKNLIAGKKVAFKLISKNKKEYEGYLTLKINGKYINFEPAGYPEKSNKK
ncbi:DNA topoisomerase [Fusobacterium sp. SYSU M8D902]|uniref:DNA topoisomerase n=1 Tax=Fusobacterium sp. SYSU M8D902 TaxID=3159562 RepID=UPI0032E4877D